MNRNRQTYKVCLATAVGLLLTLLFWFSVRGRDTYVDFQGLIPVFFWSVLVAIHFALAAYVWSTARAAPRLRAMVIGYFSSFFLLQSWVLLDYLGADNYLFARYQLLVKPQDAALHDALDQGRLDPSAVTRMLDAGANPDSRDARGARAIWKAFRQTNNPVVQLLLARGAQPDRPNKGSASSGLVYRVDGFLDRLLMSRRKGSTLLCEYLNQRRADPDPVALAFIQQLLETGADPQQHCEINRNLSAFHVALLNADTGAVELMHPRLRRALSAQDLSKLKQRLLWAAAQGKDDFLVSLKDSLPIQHNQFTYDHALTEAIKGKRATTAQRLLTWGAKPAQDDLIALSIEKCPGEIELLNQLIQAGADPNQHGAYNKTPLALAMDNKDLPLLQQLIRAGANVNKAQVRYGLLHRTFPYPDDMQLAFTDALIKAGANLEARDSVGHTFLMRAAYTKNYALTKFALDNGADPDATLRSSGRGSDTRAAELALQVNADDSLLTLLKITPPQATAADLIHAARYKSPAEVRRLVQEGLDVNSLDKYDSSALEAAMRRNRVAVYQLLLELGANPNTIINDGSPLTESNRLHSHARIQRQRALAKTDNPAFSVLAGAALANNDDAVQVLLKAGADPNILTPTGDTTLHLLAVAGHRQIPSTRALILAGAQIDRVNAQGYTPITLAAKHRAIDMIEELVRHGEDLNRSDAQGRTVLGETLHSGSVLEHLEILLKLGARPTLTDIAYANSKASRTTRSLLQAYAPAGQL